MAEKMVFISLDVVRQASGLGAALTSEHVCGAAIHHCQIHEV